MLRVLVEDIDARAHDLVRLHRQQVLEGLERLDADLVGVIDREVLQIQGQDVDRHLFDHLHQPRPASLPPWSTLVSAESPVCSEGVPSGAPLFSLPVFNIPSSPWRAIEILGRVRRYSSTRPEIRSQCFLPQSSIYPTAQKRNDEPHLAALIGLRIKCTLIKCSLSGLVKPYVDQHF